VKPFDLDAHFSVREDTERLIDALVAQLRGEWFLMQQEREALKEDLVKLLNAHGERAKARLRSNDPADVEARKRRLDELCDLARSRAEAYSDPGGGS
jgi:hypothetical protein